MVRQDGLESSSLARTALAKLGLMSARDTFIFSAATIEGTVSRPTVRTASYKLANTEATTAQNSAAATINVTRAASSRPGVVRSRAASRRASTAANANLARAAGVE